MNGSAHNDSIYPQHSFPSRWSAQDLADAVPLRLLPLRVEAIDWAVAATSVVAAAAPGRASARQPAARRWRLGYRTNATLAPFVRVH